ncbi:MAG: DNA mismatch repair endonuclease MutL [Candidatus Izemoplasmatales bacterium]
MGQIVRLDPHLSNMIAAGEVVERVGNVVKELVENALDAGSRRIGVSLREAGLAQIRVEDDGCGMDAADAALAFERHATSKIRTERDLFRIATLGFRGEALPSIAAVAAVELVTSMGDAAGRKVAWKEGRLVADEVSAAAKGTVVTVSRLFFNTPARLKFVKSPEAELAFIVELVDKYAITRPDVAFSLENDGRTLLRTRGNGDAVETLAAVYGVGVAKAMRPYAGRGRDYRVSGLLAEPLVHRASRAYVTISVNGRVVRSQRAVQAIIDGYGQSLPHGRYPIATLDIAADPSLLDVNVHPTKLEVKFSEEAELWRLVEASVAAALRDVRVILPATRPEETPKEVFQPSFALGDSEPETPAVAEPAVIYEAPVDASFPVFDYIGQFAGTYLLFQNAEGLHLVDQHAAAERIRYERYARSMGAPLAAVYEVLIPIDLGLSNADGIAATAVSAELAALGVTVDVGSDSSTAVTRVPAWFPRGMEAEYVETILATIHSERTLSTAAVRDELAKSLACKRSIKANRYINEGEVRTLLSELAKCEHPYTCPHGRPIIVRIGVREIEKWFKRIP